MTQTLVIVDIQQDYFAGGKFALPGAEAAGEQARAILASWRERELPVIHVHHLGEPDDPFFQPGTPGCDPHESVAPIAGETVIVKRMPNSFLGTSLHAELERLHATELVVIGMMSSLCIDATVRAAVDLDYSVTVAEDACAAPDLEFGERGIAAADVHAAFMAALAFGVSDVTTTDQLLADR